MPKSVIMIVEPMNPVRCTVTVIPAGAHAAGFAEPPHRLTAGQLLNLFLDIGREDLGSHFHRALLRGEGAQALISDEEALRLDFKA